MRRRTILLVSLLAVVAGAVVLDQMTWKPAVLTLPDGTTITFAGISHGAKVPAFKPRVDSPVDLDGNAWTHAREWPSTRWQERVFRFTPARLQRYLPAGWQPRVPLPALMVPYPDMMKWELSGPVSADSMDWVLTWVDKNGFEAEGQFSRFGHHDDSYPILFSESLPPCHSPRVTARIRRFVNDKPLAQWPLIAEAEMENPSLLPLPTTPVQKLPAGVTRDGITITLQSLVFDPNVPEEYERVTARLTVSSPGKSADQWWPRVAYSDARSAPDQWAEHSVRKDIDDTFNLTARTCFWTDGPWHVRIGLRPPDSEPPAPKVLHFKRVELPEATPGGKRETSDRHGTLDGQRMALTKVEYTKDTSGPWFFAFSHPPLYRGSYLTFNITDDAGRKWYQTGGAGESGLYMNVPDSPLPPPKFVDVEIILRRPQLKIFEFLVTPEFKIATP